AFDFVVVTAGTLNLASSISGNEGITLRPGSLNGTLAFTGNAVNTYTGTTTVAEGILSLNNNGVNNAIPGALVVGDSSGAANTAVVTWAQALEVSTSTVVTINSDGQINARGNTIAGLTITDGAANILASQTLTVNGLTNLTGGSISGAG